MTSKRYCDTKLSPALAYFQEQLGVARAFQAVTELEHVAVDCFDYSRPTVVPAQTLLSQLL